MEILKNPKLKLSEDVIAGLRGSAKLKLIVIHPLIEGHSTFSKKYPKKVKDFRNKIIHSFAKLTLEEEKREFSLVLKELSTLVGVELPEAEGNINLEKYGVELKREMPSSKREQNPDVNVEVKEEEEQQRKRLKLESKSEEIPSEDSDGFNIERNLEFPKISHARTAHFFSLLFLLHYLIS